MSSGPLTSSVGLVADSLSDSEATRRVFFAAGGLLVLGVVLLVATIWWWRSTKSEHPSLAPLEVMGARRWGRSGDAERDRLVNSVRPEGAQPLTPGSDPPVPVDLSRVDSEKPVGFDDLREIDAMLGIGLDAAVEVDGVEPASAAAAPGPIDDDDLADSTAAIVAANVPGDFDADFDVSADADADLPADPDPEPSTEVEPDPELADEAEPESDDDVVPAATANSSIIDPLLLRIRNQE